jgi:hypothetical protein
LAAAAAEFIAARGQVVEAAMDIEQASNQLFNTTSELIEANDDIHTLQGLNQRRDFQEVLAREREEDRTLLQNLYSWTSGEGKWKKLPCQLFSIQILGPHFIKLSFTRIRENTYTAKSIARVMGMHHGFKLCGLDAVSLVEPACIGDQRLMWSSSSVKRVFRMIEKEMTATINFTLIHDRNAKGQIIDGIKFDTRQLFIFLIRHFGLSEEAKKRSV